MMTLRGRSTTGLCHPVSTLADEDGENRGRYGGGRELDLGRAEDFEEPLIFSAAQPRGEAAQERMKKPAASGELGAASERPAREGQNLLASSGFGGKLAREPRRVHALASPGDVSGLR